MPPPGIIVGLVTPEYLASDPALVGLRDCDWAEFRGDLFGPNQALAYADFASRCPVPILHTLRLQKDGGKWPDGSAHERLQTWRDLAALPLALRPKMIDIEIEAFELGLLVSDLAEVRAAGILLLTSHHAFQATYTQETCRDWLDKLAWPRPDGVKLALQARSGEDCENLLLFAQEVAGRYAVSGVFAMGLEGQPTRLLAPLVGCPLTYGTLSGAALVPGQLPVNRLRRGIEHLHGRMESFLKAEEPTKMAQRAEGGLSRTQLSRLVEAAKAWLDEEPRS